MKEKEVENVLEGWGMKKKVLDRVKKGNEWLMRDVERVKGAIGGVKEGGRCV